MSWWKSCIVNLERVTVEFFGLCVIFAICVDARQISNCCAVLLMFIAVNRFIDFRLAAKVSLCFDEIALSLHRAAEFANSQSDPWMHPSVFIFEDAERLPKNIARFLRAVFSDQILPKNRHVIGGLGMFRA